MTSYWRHSVYLLTVPIIFSLCKTRHITHVQQLNCCVKKRQTFLRPTCSLQTAHLSPVNNEIWAVMQHCVYHRQIHSVDELKQWLIDVWCGLEQSTFDEAIDYWWGRHERVSMLKEDTTSTAFELTMLILSISVTFSVTCVTVASLIMKSSQQLWQVHSCLFYKVVH